MDARPASAARVPSSRTPAASSARSRSNDEIGMRYRYHRWHERLLLSPGCERVAGRAPDDGTDESQASVRSRVTAAPIDERREAPRRCGPGIARQGQVTVCRGCPVASWPTGHEAGAGPEPHPHALRSLRVRAQEAQTALTNVVSVWAEPFKNCPVQAMGVEFPAAGRGPPLRMRTFSSERLIPPPVAFPPEAQSAVKNAPARVPLSPGS